MSLRGHTRIRHWDLLLQQKIFTWFVMEISCCFAYEAYLPALIFFNVLFIWYIISTFVVPNKWMDMISLYLRAYNVIHCFLDALIISHRNGKISNTLFSMCYFRNQIDDWRIRIKKIVLDLSCLYLQHYTPCLYETIRSNFVHWIDRLLRDFVSLAN